MTIKLNFYSFQSNFYSFQQQLTLFLKMFVLTNSRAEGMGGVMCREGVAHLGWPLALQGMMGEECGRAMLEVAVAAEEKEDEEDDDAEEREAPGDWDLLDKEKGPGWPDGLLSSTHRHTHAQW